MRSSRISMQGAIAGGGGAGLPSSYWNPLDKDADVTLTLANRQATTVAAIGCPRGTTGRAANTGDWYFEITITGDSPTVALGLATAAFDLENTPGYDAGGDSRSYDHNGQKIAFATPAGYGSTYTIGDRIGVRFNGAGVLTFYKNGVSQGVAYAGGSLLAGLWYPVWGSTTAGAGTRGAFISNDNLPSGASPWQ